MLKLQIVSDLHLEFSDINITNNGADVLILAGDIMLAEPLYKNQPLPDDVSADELKKLGPNQQAAHRFRGFLSRVSKEFKDIIYIAGNHEFYGGRFNASIDHLKDECAKYNNIHFLERETIKIGDTTFIGCTLWTDIDRGNPHSEWAVKTGLNDYRTIRYDGENNQYSKITPYHTKLRHSQSLTYIKEVIEQNPTETFVVVGHHAPSSLSIHEMYKHEITNGAYYSDLSEFILDRPQIKLWVHGHTHTSFDYLLGTTRVICNPRGYCRTQFEEPPEWNQGLIVEV